MSDIPELTKEDLMQKPMHKLKSMCKDLGISSRPTDKKIDLVEMLITGEEKPRTKPKPKVLDNAPKQPKAQAELPEKVREEAMARGIRYDIDEDSCSVTFHGDIDVSCTLDQSERNIMNALNMTRRGRVRLDATNSLKGSFV